MKRTSFSLLATVAFGATLIGCGGGSSRLGNTGLKLCPMDYKPIAGELTPGDKVVRKSWPGSGGSDPALDTGSYEYTAMEYYVEDPGSNLRFYVTETKDNGGKFQVNRQCARGRLQMDQQLKMEFPSQFSIGPAGKITTETKTLSFQFTDRLEIKVSDAQEKPTPPSKVTEDQNYDSLFYQTQDSKGNVSYELHMKDESSPLNSYVLIRYQKVATP
jgi:hypothetical protein